MIWNYSVAGPRREKLAAAIGKEKYAFRCFLLRLGFIGAKYKAERKILLRNLMGSSAFKGGQTKEVGQLG